jgi:tape measure domain-containing protein
MATNKLGTLVYDLVADTKGFQQGVVSSRKEVTALKKVFLESRTPVEAFGIQMQGMQKLIESGSRPINMFSRSIADLAVKTKGGGREARAFVKSLREQASQIVQSVGHYRVLSKEDRERVDRLRAVARAIEREVDIQRNAIAEKLKAARQSAEADRQAKQQAIEAKRESDRRAEALKRESQALAEKARHETRVEEIQRRQRQTARQAGARMAEQQQASNLALVRRELEKTITPQQKLVTLASTARAEYAKGNITQQELVSIQRRVVAGLREINPELVKEKENAARLNAQLVERAKHEERIAAILANRRRQFSDQARTKSQQQEAQQLAMVRSELEKTISPQQKLVSLASAARAEYAKGNITQQQLASIQTRVVAGLREINPELIKERDEREKLAAATKRQADSQAALLSRHKQEAQAIRDRLDPRRALAREMTGVRELGAAGMLSPAEVAVEQKRILESLRALNPEYQEQQARLLRVRQGLQNLITPAQRLNKEIAELKTEFSKGNVSAKDYSARLKQLRSQFQDIRKVTKDKDEFNPFKGMGAQVGALIKQIAVITLMYKTLRQVSESVRDALEIERVQKQFEIFTGSAGSAQLLMSQLREFAARTPLSLQMSTQATRTLLSYGVEQQNVVDILRRLGDVSGGSAERLQRLALAFGQVRGQTRLMGQENRQLVEGGFSPLNIIAEQTGETMFSLRQRMADGEVTFKELYETLRIATDEGGRFGDALERIGNETNIGQIQRLRGEYENLRAAAGESITDVLGDFAGMVNVKLAEERKNIRKMLEEDINTTLEDVEGYFFTYMSPIRKLILEMERSRLMVNAEALEAQKEELVVNERLTQQVHDRIAAIKKQVQEQRLGRDEAELARLRASDADQKAVELLAKQLKLLKEISDEEKIRASEKERAERARKIFQGVQGDKTPEEELRAGLKELKGLADILDLDTIKKARQQLFKEFADKETEDLAKVKDATAAARGSVEEFNLLKQIDRESAVEKRHKQAMEAAAEIARKLETGNKDRKTTSQKLAESFSEAMPESISSGRVSGTIFSN